MDQLGLNLTAILLAGVSVSTSSGVLYMRRTARAPLATTAREAAGLPRAQPPRRDAQGRAPD